MLHLRRLGLLDGSAMTVTGEPLDAVLDWWEDSERRTRLRERLRAADGVDPDDRDHGARRGGAPRPHEHGVLHQGQPRARGRDREEHGDRSVAPSGADGVYRLTGPARVFTTERAAIAAIKSTGRRSHPGGHGDGAHLPRPDGRGHGGGLPGDLRAEVPRRRQIGRAAHRRALLGRLHRACIGHVGPEALAAGRSAASATATASASSSTAAGSKGPIDLVDDDGVGEIVAADAELAGRARRARPARRPRPARRHAPLGRAAARERRHLGGLRATTRTPSSTALAKAEGDRVSASGMTVGARSAPGRRPTWSPDPSHGVTAA